MTDFLQNRFRLGIQLECVVHHSCQSIFICTFGIRRKLDLKIMILVIKFFKIVKGWVILSTNVPWSERFSDYILLFYLLKRWNSNYLIIPKVHLKMDWQEWCTTHSSWMPIRNLFWRKSLIRKNSVALCKIHRFIFRTDVSEGWMF